MGFKFTKDAIRPLYLTYREAVATGDGTTTTFKLPEGASERQKVVVYLDGNPLPSDAKVPCMEGVGEPLIANGKPVLDKEGNSVLSKGRPVLQEKEGMKIPVFTHVGWRLAAGSLEFDVAPTVGTEITISRVVPSVDGIEAECFQFGKVDPNIMLEMQSDRPDTDGELYATEEEIEAKKKAEAETYRKMSHDARKKAKAKKEKEEEAASQLAFEWISRVFFRVVIGWSVRAVDDQTGERVEVPFTEENVKAYLNGDGGKSDRLRAVNLAFWLMARSADIVRAQNDRLGDIARF